MHGASVWVAFIVVAFTDRLQVLSEFTGTFIGSTQLSPGGNIDVTQIVKLPCAPMPAAPYTLKKYVVPITKPV